MGAKDTPVCAPRYQSWHKVSEAKNKVIVNAVHIFQYVKSDEAVRIVARTGRKWLHKIGTAGTTDVNLRRQATVDG